MAEGRGRMRGYLRRRRFGVRPRSCRFAFRPHAGVPHAVRRSAETPKEEFTQRSRRRAHREHRETDKGIGSRVTGHGVRDVGSSLAARHWSLPFCPSRPGASGRRFVLKSPARMMS